jgi:hypothetical protein
MENWIFGWDVQYLHEGNRKRLLCFLGGVCNTYIKILFISFEKECEHDDLVVIWNTTLDKIGTTTLGRMDYLDVQVLKCFYLYMYQVLDDLLL